MNIRILCLNIIILLFTISPVLLVGIFSNFPGINIKKDSKFYSKALCYVMLFEVTIILILKIECIHLNFNIEGFWYVISIASIPLIIIIEIIVGTLFINKTLRKKFKVNFKKIPKDLIIYSILIGIFEEIIFRGVWFYILYNDWGLNLYFVIVICAIIYGLNHLFFGTVTVIQKSVTGLIYGLLYILSGSIIIPIITHSFQNYIVLLRGDKNE